MLRDRSANLGAMPIRTASTLLATGNPIPESLDVVDLLLD